MISINKQTLPTFQQFLSDARLDGWLLYDFHALNPFSAAFLALDKDVHLTRRYYYYLPAQGEPTMLIHRIEATNFQHLPGRQLLYSGWREMEAHLAQMLQAAGRVAMEYSPMNALPYVSRVDAGTVELIQSLGPTLVSSGNIIQYFHSRWTAAGYAAHKATVIKMHRIREAAFGAAAEAVAAGRPVNEFEIQSQMMADFAAEGLKTDHPPIVAVNAHAATPHYAPTAEDHAPIQRGDLLLIDMWARQAGDPEATYVDITWTGYLGETIPERIATVFAVVKGGRDAATDFIAQRLNAGEPVTGGEVDDVCRKVIVDAGFGEYFTHRTGHSIDVEVHGAGVNIDALEVRDDRQLIEGVGFSIEPGIYLPGEFGIRSEIDCYIGPDGLEITTDPTQQEVLALLA